MDPCSQSTPAQSKARVFHSLVPKTAFRHRRPYPPPSFPPSYPSDAPAPTNALARPRTHKYISASMYRRRPRLTGSRQYRKRPPTPPSIRATSLSSTLLRTARPFRAERRGGQIQVRAGWFERTLLIAREQTGNPSRYVRGHSRKRCWLTDAFGARKARRGLQSGFLLQDAPATRRAGQVFACSNMPSSFQMILITAAAL